MILEDVLSAYSLTRDACQAHLLSSGLINSTWKLSCGNNQYIVQRINTDVFKNPEDIAENLEMLSGYLAGQKNYLFVGPVKNKTGKSLTWGSDGNAYRVFPYIKNSYTIDKVSNANEAFQAASQFGEFTFMLRDFDVRKLKITIPDFHNISLRYKQFVSAIEIGDAERKEKSASLIKDLKAFSGIIDEYESIQQNPNFIKRVTHHDTKISNVLFDEHGNGLCVIDLDTVMPGYFFSDVGDMMRTYLSPSTEEDTDFSKIRIREDVYAAIVDGYLSHTRSMLTEEEKTKFFYAGTFMIYMQALRFLTDFLNNDIYYGAKYSDHNFNRAANQLVLLEKLVEKKVVLS